MDLNRRDLLISSAGVAAALAARSPATSQKDSRFRFSGKRGFQTIECTRK